MQHATRNAFKFVVSGLFVALGTFCIAEVSYGKSSAFETWQRVLYSAETPRTYYGTPLTLNGLTPNSTVYHTYTNTYTCWETLNEDSTLTPPWSAAFTSIYNWTSNGVVSAFSNEYGVATFIPQWEDSTEAAWRNSYEKWLYNPTNKSFERRGKYKIIVNGLGGGS